MIRFSYALYLHRPAESMAELIFGALEAELRDFSAFEEVSQLVASSGLNSKDNRSGSSFTKKPASPKRAKLICGPFCICLPLWPRSTTLITKFCQHFPARHLPKLAIVVTAMRKLVPHGLWHFEVSEVV